MAEETTVPGPGEGQTAEVHVTVEQRTRRGCCLGQVVGAVITAFVVFIVLANTVAPYGVSGTGMQPTFRDGQTVLAHTTRFLNTTITLPSRGNIVLYHPNDHPNDTTIGRVIAIPGDTIEVASNSVALNGQTLTEHYIAPVPAGAAENGPGQTVPSTTLGKDQYFIMGDNRTNSRDSRNFGPVSFDHFSGIIWITLP
jgi:signal peptidase I